MQTIEWRIADLERRVHELEQTVIASKTADRKKQCQEPDRKLTEMIDRYFRIDGSPWNMMTAAEIVDRLRDCEKLNDELLMLSDHQIAIKLKHLMDYKGVERYRSASGRYYVGIEPKS